MTTPTQTAIAFYEAFSSKDFNTMQNLYADHATFSDPVFHQLTASEARAMWQMLVSRGTDLTVQFQIHAVENQTVTVDWTAKYTFNKKYPVINNVRATLQIEDGKIISHLDEFSFPKWAKQALGVVGFLFGSTGWLKRKVRSQAKAGLTNYMHSKGLDK